MKKKYKSVLTFFSHRKIFKLMISASTGNTIHNMWLPDPLKVTYLKMLK